MEHIEHYDHHDRHHRDLVHHVWPTTPDNMQRRRGPCEHSALIEPLEHREHRDHHHRGHPPRLANHPGSELFMIGQYQPHHREQKKGAGWAARLERRTTPERRKSTSRTTAMPDQNRNRSRDRTGDQAA